MLPTNAGSPIGFLVHRSIQKLIHPLKKHSMQILQITLLLLSIVVGLEKKRLEILFSRNKLELVDLAYSSNPCFKWKINYVHPFGGSVHPHMMTPCSALSQLPGIMLACSSLIPKTITSSM